MIDKALIPIAGRATRMGPLCKAAPKALLPLPAREGALLPIVHWVCSAALAADIAEVGLIVSPSHVDALRTYFSAASDTSDAPLPERIEYILQDRPRGLGDAVRRGSDFAGGGPFLMLLGDHVYAPDNSPAAEPCAAQVAGAFSARKCASLVGAQTVGPEDLSRVGVLAGDPLPGDEQTFRCTAIAEKPTLRTARKMLVTPTLGKDRFMAHAGIYAFTPEIFDCLDELAATLGDERGEVELTAAQEILLRRRPGDCYFRLVEGDPMDTGTPQGYAAAFERFRRLA